MEQGRFEEIVITTLDKLREDISSVKADVANVKLDIANVKLDVANVKLDIAEDISTVKSDIAEDISSIKSDVAWMKGKLEGRAETRHVVLTTISIVIAIGAVVVAILK